MVRHMYNSNLLGYVLNIQLLKIVVQKNYCYEMLNTYSTYSIENEKFPTPTKHTLYQFERIAR